MLKLQNKFKNIKNKKKLFLSQIIIYFFFYNLLFLNLFLFKFVLSFFNIYFLYIFI